MKFARLVILVAALVTGMSAANGNGKWKLKFLGDPGNWPKMVAEVILDLNSDGNHLTGAAHAGNWPGEAEVSDGKVDGDRISFVVIGHSPWKASNREGQEASGFPRLTFTGTIHGNEMDVHLVWDSVMIYGEAPAKSQEYDMAGKRVN